MQGGLNLDGPSTFFFLKGAGFKAILINVFCFVLFTFLCLFTPEFKQNSEFLCVVNRAEVLSEQLKHLWS